jgi:hypothetical protein
MAHNPVINKIIVVCRIKMTFASLIDCDLLENHYTFGQTLALLGAKQMPKKSKELKIILAMPVSVRGTD